MGPADDQDAVRAARGRLPLPVTVWTALAAGGSDRPGTPALCGLTISSVMLAQGQPPMVAGLVAPLSDLAEVICAPDAPFVVHLLHDGHQRLAQHFSGELPAPDDLLGTEASAHGPVLSAVTDRLGCRTTRWAELGWSTLVEAEVEATALGPQGRPLAWYRGAFTSLGRQRS